MKKMDDNKKQGILPIAVIAISIFAIIAWIFMYDQPDKDYSESDNTNQIVEKEIYTDTQDDSKSAYLLEDSVYITEIGPYIGAFVEDGSDEFVENVMMIQVENQGDKLIQLTRIKLNDIYEFEITTLLPGEKMLVIEKNKAPYPSDFLYDTAEMYHTAIFQEELSMAEDVLSIQEKEEHLVITNISGEPFAGGKVFYKNMVDEVYLGGITYFGTIPELEVGETIEMMMGHYHQDSSKLRFVTYAKNE